MCCADDFCLHTLAASAGFCDIHAKGLVSISAQSGLLLALTLLRNRGRYLTERALSMRP